MWLSSADGEQKALTCKKGQSCSKQANKHGRDGARRDEKADKYVNHNIKNTITLPCMMFFVASWQMGTALPQNNRICCFFKCLKITFLHCPD